MALYTLDASLLEIGQYMGSGGLPCLISEVKLPRLLYMGKLRLEPFCSLYFPGIRMLDHILYRL